MFGNMDMGNLQEMLGDVQDKAKELQEKSAEQKYTAKSGGGMVQVTINGNSEVIDLEIDDSLLEDKDSMQILLISAFNEALQMVEDNKKHMAMQMLGGMNPFGAK